MDRQPQLQGRFLTQGRVNRGNYRNGDIRLGEDPERRAEHLA
jgi:hypothetical protein